MRSIIILFVSLLAIFISTTSGYSQDCKKVKTEIDKFTKEETKSGSVYFGKVKLIKGYTIWYFNVTQVNGETTISVSIASLGEFNQVLNNTAYFYFLLDNGNVVKLQNTQDALPVTQAVANGKVLTVYTNYILTLKPSLEELKSLSSGNVTDVKVEVPSQQFLTPEVSKKDAKTFQSIIMCMLETAK